MCRGGGGLGVWLCRVYVSLCVWVGISAQVYVCVWQWGGGSECVSGKEEGGFEFVGRDWVCVCVCVCVCLCACMGWGLVCVVLWYVRVCMRETSTAQLGNN